MYDPTVEESREEEYDYLKLEFEALRSSE